MSKSASEVLARMAATEPAIARYRQVMDAAARELTRKLFIEAFAGYAKLELKQLVAHHRAEINRKCANWRKG